jgi:hypothetical protein
VLGFVVKRGAAEPAEGGGFGEGEGENQLETSFDEKSQREEDFFFHDGLSLKVVVQCFGYGDD